jgi:Uma2 family endonuclease
MNEMVRFPKLPLTTQAAEGLMRRKWSVAEIEAMVEAGILNAHERIELIGGEVVPMSPKGIQHEVMKAALNRFWNKRLPDEIVAIPETTFRMDEFTFIEPDFTFYLQSDGLKGLRPATALLCVEVSDTSLAYDRGRKTRLYNSFGVREVWVIDAVRRITHINRIPALDGYSETLTLGPDEPLVLPFAPDIAVRLADLPTD